MNVRHAMRGCAVAAIGAMAVAASAQSEGPDVIAGSITGPQLYGVEDGKSAYSIGTTSCNIGDENLLWDDSTFDGTPANLHPVMGQNIFRLKDGRIEQIGQSWLKHAFCALQLSGLCDSCQPAGGGCTDELGPGCHDPYSASLNGSQSGMGPKFEVNAATGEYPWPYTGDGQTGSTGYKRIQVDNDDLDPAQNPDALYFGEGQYVAPDDAQADNDNNNASYRDIQVQSFSGGWNLNFTGSTHRGDPAIQAWADHDGGVAIAPIDVPDDGRFWFAYKVTENDDGTYRYEYAIQNLNSDRSGGQVTIPIGNGVEVSNAGFHDVDYHSGEPFDNTDWDIEVTGSEVVWSSPETFQENENSNALRWGTLYNFWFDADTAPTSGEMTLGLFKPGTPASMAAGAEVPSGASCPADINGDGEVSSDDFLAYIDLFSAGDPEADFTGDGTVGSDDFLAYIDAFAAGCG